MSNFQNYYSFLIDIGSTVAQWQAEFKQRLTDNGWQVIAEHIPSAVLASNQAGYLDVIPPASEQIGNATYQEITRFKFITTGVTVQSYVRVIEAQTLQTFTLTNTATGTSVMSFYMDGLLLTLPGVGSNTAAQNALLFYNYLVAHANERPQMFNWSINGAIITATAKAIKPLMQILLSTYSSPYISFGGISAASFLMNKTHQSITYGYATTDFTNGFIYFLTINSRSIQLSTKTTTNYYGPIYAHYGDHVVAVAQTPPNCTPIELVIGYSGSGTTRIHGHGRPTHIWGSTFNYAAGYELINPAYDGVSIHNFGPTGNKYGFLADLTPTYHASGTVYGLNGQSVNGNESYVPFRVSPFGVDVTTLYASVNYYGEFTIFSGNSVLPNVLRAEQFHNLVANSGQSIYVFATCPAINLEDIYTANFTATNESLHLVRSLTTTAILQTQMDATSAYGTITLSDATFFAVNGSIIIDNETFEYTGKSGNNLTGVSRAKYGTTMAIHDATTDIIYQAVWMVKINSALHMAGTTKPLN